MTMQYTNIRQGNASGPPRTDGGMGPDFFGGGLSAVELACHTTYNSNSFSFATLSEGVMRSFRSVITRLLLPIAILNFGCKKKETPSEPSPDPSPNGPIVKAITYTSATVSVEVSGSIMVNSSPPPLRRIRSRALLSSQQPIFKTALHTKCGCCKEQPIGMPRLTDGTSTRMVILILFTHLSSQMSVLLKPTESTC